jgi:hypothetical protein
MSFRGIVDGEKERSKTSRSRAHQMSDLQIQISGGPFRIVKIEQEGKLNNESLT